MKPLRVILLLGIVSLLGDIAYEGARSVLGPFLATLGVSAFTLGLVVGFSEFASYGFRLISGYLVDRSRRYWLMTFLGYGLILAIPLLALAYDWRIAALLIVLERIGKGIRSPARDTILSFATREVGRGYGFGIHEALDQIGALAGPILVFAVLYLGFGYRCGFAILAIPAVLLLLFLAYASFQVPNPERFEEKSESKPSKTLWIYVAFVLISTAGFVNFQILSYHYKLEGVGDELIPILYAAAMGADAAFAVAVGRLYDRIGFKTLMLVPILTALIPLAFLNPLAVLVLGLTMAVHETVMRSAVADLVAVDKRGTAYGFLNLAYGIGLFLGSSTVGYLYGVSLGFVWVYVVTVEVLACILALMLINAKPQNLDDRTVNPDQNCI